MIVSCYLRLVKENVSFIDYLMPETRFGINEVASVCTIVALGLAIWQRKQVPKILKVAVPVAGLGFVTVKVFY